MATILRAPGAGFATGAAVVVVAAAAAAAWLGSVSQTEGQTLLSDILIITARTRLCYSNQLISMQLIVHVRLTQHHAKLRRSCITAVKHVKIKVKKTGD